MRAITFGLAAAAAVLLPLAPLHAGGPPPDSARLLVSSGGNGYGGGYGHGHGYSGNGGVWINGGEWARYNNRSFDSDSFNDWWHDRPDRAYPAWMRNNENCQRQWFAGSQLRC